MAELTKKERAGLPDRAFAYVDSQGHRRVPIHDEAHVRNALARFDRVAFEDDAAEERARRRLLNAAKKYRIVPVGFVTGQVRKLRSRSRGSKGCRRDRHLPGNRGRECLSSVVWAYRHLRR